MWQCLFIIMLVAAIVSGPACNDTDAEQEGYKKFLDPAGRYSIEYPATMSPEIIGPDEVKFSHPQASLRMKIVLEPRTQKGKIDEQALLNSLRKHLSEDSREASILEEGRLPGVPGLQGYFVCSFKDKRGMKVMQLLQFCVFRDKVLQLIISDRPQGFMNVEKVIRRIHRSLKILKPDLN